MEYTAKTVPYKECIMCSKPVAWVRCTQFAGDHPFCEECAKKEEDFGKDDPSYFYWIRVEPEPPG